MAGCPSDGASGEGSSCATLADYIEALCGEGGGSLLAAEQRHDCEAFPWPASKKLCVLRAQACSEEALDACELHSRTWVCAVSDEECPDGLACDTELGECRQCGDDGDCDSEMLCVDGWCIDDTAVNRELAKVLTL